MNEDKPSIFGEWEFIHIATLVCTSCNGAGSWGDIICGGCMGETTYTKGCSAPARIDPLHPALGGECSGCQSQVPLEELTHGGTSNDR